VVGELFAGRYELEELAGAGGMSSVYRAHDLRLNRRVAVKILDDRYSDDPDLVGRFSREARAVARLNHPHIVTILDRGEAAGRQFIVFEHVDEDLKRLVCRTGPLPPGRAVQLAIEIASALAFAHANGIVHRDVKPQNVLIRSGSAKVSDFGIARADDPAIGDGETTTGMLLGTGDYISPEQARGERATERSDVYSLGALLYELLTGHVPFPAESALAAAMRHASEPPPDLLAERPELPARLAAAVGRAMAKDPQERFESMDELLAELVACGRDLPTPDLVQTMVIDEAPTRVPPAAPTQARPRPASTPRRRSPRRRAAFVVLLVLAIVGAGAGYTLHSSGHGSPGPRAGTANAATVELRATGAYDPPPGDGAEDDSRVAAATDRNASTYWETEHYTTVDFGNLKQGVGLVLDAGRSMRLGTIEVRTPTPGFEATVKAGDSPNGPFPDEAASTQTVDARTTFTLHVSSPHRYYVIWITALTRVPDGSSTTPYGAQVSEVTAT
jgi:serine/threonine-protein kinase